MADRAPINYDEFIADQRKKGTIPFTAGGKTFHIIPPDLMDDDSVRRFHDLMSKEQAGESYDVVEFARLIVDDYDGFAAAGGSATGLISLMEKIETERATEQGVQPGESAAS